MFILLLFASSVTGEWVEIAQNHYRKEPSRRVTAYEETSKANRIYPNHTITERSWNRGMATRIPNVGNVKRVKLPSKTEDEFTIGILYDNPEKITINSEYENFSSVRDPNLKNAKSSEAINVKRKNNDDNTRKMFSETNDKHDIRISSQYPIRRTQVTPNNATSMFQQNSKETIEKNKSQIVKISNSRKHEIFHTDYDFTVEKESYNIKRVQSVADVDANANSVPNVYTRQNSNKRVNTHDNNDNIRIKKEHIEIPANNKIHEFKNVLSNSPLIISSKINELHKSRDKFNPNKSPTIDDNANEINKSNIDTLSIEKMKIENAKNVVKNNQLHTDNESIIENNNMVNNSKNNIEVLLKFMKLVTDNIARNTRRSFKGKMKYLELLRNNILSNIEERIDQTWPDEVQQRRRRAARGHVEFPSSESALMTISFLTFAVFLIKLVLQVIHTYKNKTMMVTPAVVAAVGRTAATLREQT